jgi:hypothetical protein
MPVAGTYRLPTTAFGSGRVPHVRTTYMGRRWFFPMLLLYAVLLRLPETSFNLRFADGAGVFAGRLEALGPSFAARL